MRLERTDLGVAVTVLAGLGLVVAAVLWLTRFGGDDTYPLYVEYDRAGGLVENAPVRYEGFEIGRVRSIDPRMTDEGSVVFRVEMRIEEQLETGDTLKIPMGTVAKLTHPPVVGPPFVMLEPPERWGAVLPAGSVLPGAATVPPLEQLQTTIGRLSFDVSQTLGAARRVMDSVEHTLSGVNRTVASTRREIVEMSGAVRAELDRADSLLATLEEEMERTGPEVRETMDSARIVLGETRQLLVTLNRFAGSNEAELSSIVASLDTATYVLNHLVRELGQKPLRIFTGVPAPPPMPVRESKEDSVPPP